MAAVVVLFALNAQVASANVARAIKQSQQTGKPIFAVAGASYCPACNKLMNTLNSDESLRPYIDQFVPLKLNAQSKDYAAWKQFFPPKRAAIPALFIVTPQGKELYSAVGALPTKSLQKVMLTSLEKAERFPTKEQWKEIATTLTSAQEAIDNDELEQAFELLQPTIAGLEQMGPLLELTEAGRKTVTEVQALAAQQRSMLDESLRLFVSKGDFHSAVQVATWEEMLQMFPQQRKPVAVAIKDSVRDSEQRKLLRQARELQQAAALARQSEAKAQRKALVVLKRVIKRYPNTEASALAEQQLAALGK